MRRILPFLLILCGSLVWAQQSAPEAAAPETDPAIDGQAKQPPPETGEPSDAPAETAPLRQGHPLDPHDVDVLTGKIDREAQAQRYGRGAQVYLGDSSYYGYMGYGVGGRGGRAFRPFVFGAQPFFFHSGLFFPRRRSGGFWGGRVP